MIGEDEGAERLGRAAERPPVDHGRAFYLHDDASTWEWLAAEAADVWHFRSRRRVLLCCAGAAAAVAVAWWAVARYRRRRPVKAAELRG